MNLNESLESMIFQPGDENYKAFAGLFRQMTEDNTKVYTTCRPSGTGYGIDTVPHAGSNYCVMYSDRSTVKKREGSSLCMIGLSDLINSVYSNPHVAGVVIDPEDTQPVFISRRDLQPLSGKPDPRLEKRDWGEGIPEYTPADLLSAEEAMSMAMTVTADSALSPDGFTVSEANSSITSFPNFIAEKNGQLYYISVGVAAAPNVPRLDPDMIAKLRAIAAENSARLLYAPVAIAPADPQRMQKGLLLVGDEFIINFAGLLDLS